MQIRETTVGFPNKNVIAQSHIRPNNINIDGTFTRILFNSPVWLYSGTEYALVILTDDEIASVAVAELGKLDTVHNVWVTSQAYQTGVLLSSSNASTWTSHQELDLTFRLLACKFTESVHMVDLGTVTASNHTDILTLANVERPSSSTDCEFVYTDSDGNINTLSEDMATQLTAKINGEVSLKARLKGNSRESPVLYPGVQTVFGKINETADYVTRAIVAGNNVKVSVIYDCTTPGSSEVKAYCQNSDSTWQLMALTKGEQIGNSWQEHTHIIENFSATTTRVKLVLSSSVLYRPKVQNLRVIIV